MSKSLISVHKDLEPLFKLEKNKTQLVNDLLRAHYTKAPAVVDSAEVDTVANENSEPELQDGLDTYSKAETAESQFPTPSIDGRIEEPSMAHVDGRVEPSGPGQ